MKGNKTLVTLLFIVSNITLLGQINPVNNLYYQQFYDYGNHNCPAFNCFVLSWQPPDSTSDTLIGYKVYRNGNYYAFLKDPGLGCGGAVPCNYNDWYSMIPFWVTVKAVYNHDSLVSGVNDSIEVSDIAIKINEIKQQKTSLLKNPIQEGENISLLIPSATPDNLTIELFSLSGQNLKCFEVKNVSKSVIYLPTTSLGKGLYFIKIEMKGWEMTLKLLIE
jgi:hypothetical protein